MNPQRSDVEIIEELPKLLALESDYASLFARTPAATPFQSPDWSLPWAEYLAEAGSLRVIAIRRGAELVAVVPLVLERASGERVLRLLGHGISDYLDALVDPEHADAVLGDVSASVGELALAADRVELGDLPRSSLLLRCRARGFLVGAEPAEACPRVALPGSFAELERTLPSWLGRNVRQTQARLSRSGALSFGAAEPSELAGALEAFFELHAARWRTKGTSGVLADATVQAFHRRAAPRLAASKHLQLSVLRVDGRCIGAAYVLVRNDAHLYLTGFDPGLEHLSLGSLLIARTLARAIEDRRGHYDFLRGREAYKYAWGAVDEVTAKLRWERESAAESRADEARA